MSWRYFNRSIDVWVEDAAHDMRLWHTKPLKDFKLYRKLVIDADLEHGTTMPNLINLISLKGLLEDKYFISSPDEDQIAICHWEEVHQ